MTSAIVHMFVTRCLLLGGALLGPAVGWFWQWKGLSYWSGLGMSFVLTPPVAFLVGLARQSNQAVRDARRLADGTTRKCTKCGELVRAEAAVCRFCAADLSSQAQQQPSTKLPRYINLLTTAGLTLGLLVVSIAGINVYWNARFYEYKLCPARTDVAEVAVRACQSACPTRQGSNGYVHPDFECAIGCTFDTYGPSDVVLKMRTCCSECPEGASGGVCAVRCLGWGKPSN